MLQGLKLAEEYIVAIPSLSSLPDILLLNVFLDSMCSASTLSPHKVHKSVAPRNLTTKIMRVSKAIVTSAPKIQIYFSHLQSSSLPADLNSKAMDNPLQISSSELWRSGPIEYFRTTPPTNWFLKVTSDSMDWQQPVADPKMATSLFCSCNASPDFCGHDEENFYCPTCTTSTFNCSDILNHIENFCPEPPPRPELSLSSGVMKPGFASNPVTPVPLSDEEYTPLENKVFRRSLKFSKLEKIVRIIAIHNFIRKSMKPNSASLAHIIAIMMCKPKFLDSVKQFKPTENEMYQAFLKLVKTSQNLYSPSSKYFKPEVHNSIIIASLRFDDTKAQELLGVRHLPLISSKDVDLVKLLFLHGHILDAGPFNLHLNKGGTLARMKQGSYATVIPHARKIIKPHLKNCVRCLRNAKIVQTFSPPVGNPRFFSLLESSSPIFLGISMDMLGPANSC